ncbi:MAG TPA: arginase family protein [Candidatus Baltobacteraceae bacterium]|nr:arginase family protein [Candidatus Baltobacteraceae bacterium]
MPLPFTGIPTFVQAPLYQAGASPSPQAVILGIPTDEGTTQHPGARYGPRAIREGSTQFTFYKRGRGYYDPERDRPMLASLEIRDAGDVDIVPTALDENATRIAAAVADLVGRGIFPVCLGGDHSVTPAILQGFAGTPLHVVQIDAHMDYVDRLGGMSGTHASPMRRLRELPHVRSLTQIGIRSIVSSGEDYAASRAAGNRIVTTAQVLDQPDRDWLVGHEGEGYLTLDIDAFEPGAAPGTGFAEPGGLGFREVARLIRLTASRLRLRGMDLVEVNPYLDPTRRTGVLAARAILEVLSAVFDSAVPGPTVWV